jgi:glycosyltransferase involved in cell wall biosynthesis
VPAVKRRLIVLSEIIAPYRIPVFNALAARSDIDLHVIFLSETDRSLRQWRVYKDEIRFSFQVLPSWRYRLGRYNLLLNRGVGNALGKSAPHAVLCGGYNYVVMWQAARWARRRKVPLLLWSESTSNDLRREFRVVERAKIRFLRLCSAFVVPGRSSREYLAQLGAGDKNIFVAPNALDIGFYAELAQRARARADEVRARLKLPSRYFLFVGRLVREKGVFDLLDAYSLLEERERSQVGLVLAGDGILRSALEKRAAGIRAGCVRFTGFAQREQLAELYALAEALVFPSHTDPWGFVVNEATACRLPIIASKVAGCVAELVADGENGFVVSPGDVEELADAMRKIVSNPALAAEMGVRSAARIQGFTPAAWAAGIAEAVRFACG